MKAIFTQFIFNFFRIIWNFRPIFLTLFIFLIICAAAIALIEKLPFVDALYFSFITGLTIGYGDIVVKTFLGRVVAILIGFIGVLSTGLLVAAAVYAVQKTYYTD